MKRLEPIKIAMWAVVALFAWLVAKEAPSLRRYLKMRSM